MRTYEPFYWVNDLSKTFLSRDYLSPGETVTGRIRDIANNAERILNKPGFSDKFYDYMSKGFYSLATPVWTNFGKARGMPVSCFNSHVTDDVGGILYAQGEVGMMSKIGGGTSGYFGDVRPRGAEISDNGKSTGVVHFLELFQATTDVISQGSARRGRMAPYLPITHPDIDEFLDIGSDNHAIQDMNSGVVVDNEFMVRMISGDTEARRIWAKLLKRRKEIGYPYIMFRDNANNQAPEVYKDKGLTINSSNLCMVGTDRVVSSNGYLTAKELHDLDEELTLFDGSKAVKASKMVLREKDVDVYTITLDNGMKHTVTSYHGIPVMDEFGKSYKRVECKDLKLGDRVPVQVSKGLFGTTDMSDEAFLLGLYQSDGTQHKDIIMLDVWENDFDILDEVEKKFANVHYKYGMDTYNVRNQTGGIVGTRNRQPAKFTECTVSQSAVRKKRLSSKTLHKALNFQKGFIPDWIWSANEATQWEYVRGLLIADGSVHVSSSQGSPIQVAYADINKGFLEELQLLFNNLGLRSSIRLLREEGETLLPDGKGGHKLYNTKTCYRLLVGNKTDALEIEKHTGFLSRKGIKLEDREYRDNVKKAYKIVSIEYSGKEDVYCPTVFTEDHVFVAQGMLTYNCNEIYLPSTEDESFTCVLSSMNLLHYDEWKDTDAVETLIYFLDSVAEEFITKLEAFRDSPERDHQLVWEYMKRAHRFTKRHRALGMGALGLHSLYQSKMIAFESREAARLNLEIFKLLRKKSHEASRQLAVEYGEPEALKGYGRRNTTTMAIAPTTSSAFILGQVSQSIEPLFSNCYVKDLAKVKAVIKNKYLEELLESKGYNTRKTWEIIITNDGSVLGLSDDILSPEEKAVFLTFGEISQETVIDQAAARQDYIDQGQSLNLMIPGTVTAKEINALHIRAWQLGLKGLYYLHGTNAAQALLRSKNKECLACSS